MAEIFVCNGCGFKGTKPADMAMNGALSAGGFAVNYCPSCWMKMTNALSSTTGVTTHAVGKAAPTVAVSHGPKAPLAQFPKVAPKPTPQAQPTQGAKPVKTDFKHPAATPKPVQPVPSATPAPAAPTPKPVQPQDVNTLETIS